MPNLIVPTLFGQRRYELLPFDPSDPNNQGSGYKFQKKGFTSKTAGLDARRIRREKKLPSGVKCLVIIGRRRTYLIYYEEQGGLRVASFSLYFCPKDFYPSHIACLSGCRLSARAGMDGDGP